jgi:hypothetical protein
MNSLSGKWASSQTYLPLEALTRVSLPGTERAWRFGISIGCVSSLLPQEASNFER